MNEFIAPESFFKLLLNRGLLVEWGGTVAFYKEARLFELEEQFSQVKEVRRSG